MRLCLSSSTISSCQQTVISSVYSNSTTRFLLLFSSVDSSATIIPAVLGTTKFITISAGVSVKISTPFGKFSCFGNVSRNFLSLSQIFLPQILHLALHNNTLFELPRLGHHRISSLFNHLRTPIDHRILSPYLASSSVALRRLPRNYYDNLSIGSACPTSHFPYTRRPCQRTNAKPSQQNLEKYRGRPTILHKSDESHHDRPR